MKKETEILKQVNVKFMRVSWICGSDNLKFLTSLVEEAEVSLFMSNTI